MGRDCPVLRISTRNGCPATQRRRAARQRRRDSPANVCPDPTRSSMGKSASGHVGTDPASDDRTLFELRTIIIQNDKCPDLNPGTLAYPLKRLFD